MSCGGFARDDEKGHPVNGRLNIAARAHASADPHAVWALLEDVNRYKAWGPWSESRYVEQPVASPHGPGAVRRLRYRNRRAVTIEPVVEVQARRRLVHDVVSGIPVRNYRATVELTPNADGTDIGWSATFDRTLRGRLSSTCSRDQPRATRGSAATASSPQDRRWRALALQLPPVGRHALYAARLHVARCSDDRAAATTRGDQTRRA